MTTNGHFGLPLGSHSPVNPTIVIHTSPGPDDSSRPDKVKVGTAFDHGATFRVLDLGQDDDQTTTSGYHSKADDYSMATRGTGFGTLVTAWAPEAVWSLLSVGLLAALVILLNQYNGKPLPDWPAGLTLNAAVALIATILRAVTVMIVSEGLSQLKWNRFAFKDRRLTDLHIFDQASRGPWGSLLMLLKARGGVLGIAAAVVFVSGLATSTVTQSAISFSTRMVEDPNGIASVLVRHSYGEGSTERNTSDPGAMSISGTPDAIENVAFQAVYQPLDQDWPMTAPKCSSGDCHWRTFSSLALCYDIKNVTDKLKVTSRDGPDVMTEQNATLSLPVNGDIYLSDNWKVYWDLGPYNIVNWTSPRPGPWAFGDPGRFRDKDPRSFPPYRESVAYNNDSDVLRATVSQWLVIYNNGNANIDDDNHKYRAAELLWHFCVNTYNVSVQGGKPTTEIIASSTKIRNGQGDGFELPLNEDPKLQDFSIAAQDEKSEFKIHSSFDYERLDMITRFGLQGGFSSKWMPGGVSYNELSRGVAIRMFAGVTQNTTAEEGDGLVWRNLNSFAGTVADGITNFMRNKGVAQEGQPLISKTFVRVRWEWLAFVAAQVGLSIVFLVCVGWHTASLGVDIVKDSNLAELFAVRNMPDHGHLASGISGIGPDARKRIVARLRQRDGVWALELELLPDQAHSLRELAGWKLWSRRGPDGMSH